MSFQKIEINYRINRFLFFLTHRRIMRKSKLKMSPLRMPTLGKRKMRMPTLRMPSLRIPKPVINPHYKLQNPIGVKPFSSNPKNKKCIKKKIRDIVV
jgi:hypothetical protein